MRRLTVVDGRIDRRPHIVPLSLGAPELPLTKHYLGEPTPITPSVRKFVMCNTMLRQYMLWQYGNTVDTGW